MVQLQNLRIGSLAIKCEFVNPLLIAKQVKPVWIWIEMDTLSQKWLIKDAHDNEDP